MRAGGDGHTAAAWALRLSLPTAPPAAVDVAGLPWPLVHTFARRERLVALAWHRQGALVRQAAPPAIADAWRADAAADSGRAIRRTAELGALLDGLEAAGVEPIVLKGLPLSARLYGSVALRPSADIDLFVRADQRAAADVALRGVGWTHLSGESPAEGIYKVERPGTGRQLLEVHSHLADDVLLRHLRPPPPDYEWVEVDGRRMRAHRGDYLPVYLAVQLAKHATSPLLWLVDFETLWSSIDERARRAAESLARESGAARYLAWAVRRAAFLPAARRGERAALEALGVRPDGSVRRGHNALRVAALAATPAAALGVAGSWLWPNDDGRGAEFLIRRARRAVSAAVGVIRPMRAEAPVATATVGVERSTPAASRTVDGAGLLDAVRTVVTDTGGAMWIRAYGGSMAPAIPHGARIHLVPLGERGPQRGEVVVAAANGVLVHRVVATWRDRVLLQGDAMARSDRPVPRAALLARVDAVEVGPRVEPMLARPRPPIWRQLRRSPRQIARLLRAATAPRAPHRPS